jgi:phytoene desaturase
LRCKADVRRILVEDGAAKGVELAGGERLAADIVVSNADSAWTYRHLVPAENRRHWTDRRLNRASYSMGLFVWYFGVDRRYEDIGHHTILMGPRYRALLKDIFQRKILAEDFSLYLHRPTATDPALAPPGCDTFYVLSPVPNLLGGQDWSVEAEPYRRRIEAWLEANLLPGLSKHIVTSRITTPIDFRDRLNASHGEGFGLEPLLLQSAWFRPHNRSEEVQNLFLVGAGVHPGAGLPGVLSSARVLDKVAPDASVFV